MQETDDEILEMEVTLIEIFDLSVILAPVVKFCLQTRSSVCV